MGVLDSPLRSVAQTLMGLFGTPVSATFVSHGDYDAEAGLQDTTETTTIVDAVLAEYSISQIDDVSIKVGDRKAYIAAADLAEPKPDNELVIGADTYRVVSVQPVQATDQAALYEVQIRRL